MKSYQIILLGKTNGEVIPKSMSNRIKAFIRKKFEGGASIETLKSLILQAFDRDNIVGSLTIRQNGQVYLKVGN
jgi:hypothetical protein